MSIRNTSPLATLYAQFHEAILHNDASHAAHEIKTHPRLSTNQQLAIYLDGYRTRLLETLMASFPATVALLGEAAFEQFARGYIEAQPPTSYSIDHYTFGLPAYLLSRVEAFVAEVARLEAAIAETFWAPHAEPLRLEGMTEDQLLSLRLRLRPATQLFTAQYPVNAWLTAFRTDPATLPPIPAPSPDYLLLHRHRSEVVRIVLMEAEYHLLAQFMHAVPIGQAIESAMREHPALSATMEASLQAWFAQWAAQGYLFAE